MIIGLAHEGESISYTSVGYIYQALIAAGAVTYSPFPDNVREALRFYPTSPTLIACNLSIPGTRLATGENSLIGRAVTNLYPLIPASGSLKADRKYIFSVSAGANPDSGFPQDLADDMGSYCLAAKAAGFDKVIVGTLVSRTDGIFGDPGDTIFDLEYAQPYNAIIKGGAWQAANDVDGIFDLASDARLGATGAADNATYFEDQVHLTTEGHAIAAPIWWAKVTEIAASLT